MTKYVDSAALKKSMELQKGYIDTQDAKKQDVITPGTGLAFDGTTLNVTLDTTLFKVVTELPTAPATGDENKIHLVPNSTAGTNNSYIEYIYVNSAWEKLGEYTAAIDLTPYLKTVDLIGAATANTLAFSKASEAFATLVVSGQIQGTASEDGKTLTIDLKDVTTAAESDFYKVAVNAKGQVTGTVAVTLADLTALGVAKQADLDTLSDKVSAIETLTETEVQTMYNEVYA